MLLSECPFNFHLWHEKVITLQFSWLTVILWLAKFCLGPLGFVLVPVPTPHPSLFCFPLSVFLEGFVFLKYFCPESYKCISDKKIQFKTVTGNLSLVPLNIVFQAQKVIKNKLFLLVLTNSVTVLALNNFMVGL